MHNRNNHNHHNNQNVVPATGSRGVTTAASLSTSGEDDEQQQQQQEEQSPPPAATSGSIFSSPFKFPSALVSGAAAAPSATAASTALLSDNTVSATGSNKGVIFVDIAVPRNVHADCKDVAGAHCYNVDDLKTVVARNTEKRSGEIAAAEIILREEE